MLHQSARSKVAFFTDCSDPEGGDIKLVETSVTSVNHFGVIFQMTTSSTPL